ncbi:uncharacterized protein METZ01_LOCUS247928 [marine metagenome]|uniref:C1q domain-containing protein n=1 Tax=marine metagenome TaxID=408172 RepID=A0A382I5U5_9ZZZZ
MAKVKITGHASGTGILTVTAPNTSSDRTITLPDATGTLLNSDGSAASLTAIPAANITGTLPAISGANLTGVGIDCDADAWNYAMDVQQDNTTAAIFDINAANESGSNISESGGVITVGTAGWYLIILSVGNDANDTQYTDVNIRKNSTALDGSRIYWDNFGGTQYFGKTVSVIVEASADDTFDVYGRGHWYGSTTINPMTYWLGIRIGA